MKKVVQTVSDLYRLYKKNHRMNIEEQRLIPGLLSILDLIDRILSEFLSGILLYNCFIMVLS